MRKAIPLFFLFSLIAYSPWLLAQEGVSEKNVLIIPFERYEFHTEMPLAEINRVNKVNKDEFYSLLVSTFTHAFELNSNDKVFFKTIDDKELPDVHKKVSYAMDGSKGHFLSNLDRLPESDYQFMLSDNDCDHMIFITWYRITRTKKAAKIGKVRKISQYAYHYIDYDVYNRKKELILKKSRVNFMVKESGENLNRMGVHIDDLKPVFSDLAQQISKEIQAIE